MESSESDHHHLPLLLLLLYKPALSVCEAYWLGKCVHVMWK